MGSLERVASGVDRIRTLMVNLYFVAVPEGARPQWVLVDSGLPGYAASIRSVAENWFGKGTKPAAIVLTHGHFDHAGNLPQLLRDWDVPLYAHSLELPYLTGRSPYPPPDPLVGGGALAWLAPLLYSRGPFNLDGRVQAIPADGRIPELPGWRVIHTPGHSAGHVSLLRERDRALIAGDAVITVKQESAYAVLTQRTELHGPPAYFTTDWQAAAESVRALNALEPEVLATGHGRPMYGAEMRAGLTWLAGHFEQVAVPGYGRYVRQPARTDARGIVSLPPNPLPKVIGTAAGIASAAVIAGLLVRRALRAAAATPAS